MQYKIHIIFFQLITILNQHGLVNCKALKGRNVKTVERGQYTYIVTIAKYNQRDRSEFIVCTGSLVTLSHILTAEHCFVEIKDRIFLVIAGSHKLKKGKRYQASWWVSYDQWARAANQPLYHPSSDLAMIKLLNEVKERVTVATFSSVDLRRVTPNHNIVVLGWGQVENNRIPEKFRWAKVKIVGHNECSSIITSIYNETILVPAQYICTKADPYVLIAHGDSGGPLLCDGEIAGINRGLIPDDSSVRHPDTFNMHLQIRIYMAFVNSTISL